MKEILNFKNIKNSDMLPYEMKIIGELLSNKKENTEEELFLFNIKEIFYTNILYILLHFNSKCYNTKDALLIASTLNFFYNMLYELHYKKILHFDAILIDKQGEVKSIIMYNVSDTMLKQFKNKFIKLSKIK